MAGKYRGMTGLLMGILLMVCCITGCGKGEPVEEETSADSVQREEKDDYDLTAEQWSEAGAAEESGESWVLVEYKEDFGQKAPDKEMTKSRDINAADGSDYYILENYMKWGYTGKGIQKYYLTHVNMQTLESERVELILSEGENKVQEEISKLAEDIDEGWAFITGMDAQEGRICLLVRQIDRESNMTGHCYAVWLDEQKKVESVTDLLPGMNKAGMFSEDMLPEGILCDREGHFYIKTEEYGIFDSTGEFLKMMEVPGGNENVVYQTCKLSDGCPVFESVGYENGQTILFRLDGLEEKILYQGQYDSAQTRYLNSKGEIFYFGPKGLLRWDAATGKCECIYQDSSLDPLSCQTITETSDNDITMAFYDKNSEIFFLRLQLNAEVEEKVVTIYQWFEIRDLVQYAGEYSRKTPGVKIEFVTINEAGDEDTVLNRLVARMTAGERPDLFLVSPGDLKILQDKGVLADLQERLPQELLDQVFPGALRSGMIEDKLYGIADEVNIDTVVVSKDIWPEETWSYRDVMALTEENNTDEGGFTGVLGGETQEMLLYDLALRDITAGNSSLADRETKECHFDSEEFVRILEFCKKYGLNSDSRDSLTSREIMKDMQDGKILAYRVEGDLQQFSQIMAALGDGFHCVGFPTEGGYSGYASVYYQIAMNADGANQAEALDFIEYLLSERVQRNVGICTVRRDVLTDNVKDGKKDSDEFQMYQTPVFQNGSRAVIPLDGKPDGSSFLPEYLEVLEKADFLPSNYGALERMILEEARGYFDGDRTAEDVAGIIQSRVWVYLNE